MGLNHVKQLSDYLRTLRENSAEVHALFKDLLIGVTRFYREKEAWQVLDETVICRATRDVDIRPLAET